MPHAGIYAGWNEVSIPGLKSRPDALAWGEIQGVETLFWLEVETGNVSRRRLLDNTSVRWMKAKAYSKAANVHLIFVLLGMPWVQETARTAFRDVPANWNKFNFGKLPYPKWGEVVAESFS